MDQIMTRECYKTCFQNIVIVLSGSRLSDYIMFDTDAYLGKEHKKLTANQQNNTIGIVERGNWAAKTPGSASMLWNPTN